MLMLADRHPPEGSSRNAPNADLPQAVYTYNNKLMQVALRSLLKPVCITAGVFVLFAGCRIHSQIDRKPIEKLVQEALDQGAQRPSPVIETSTPMTHLQVPESATLEQQTAILLTSSSLVFPQTETPGADAMKINEVFDQTDIREAIQVLAGYGQHNVVIDDTVGGVTSAQIKDDTFEVALDKIVMPLGLIWARHEGKYLIAPPDPDSPLFSYISERHQFSPKFHDITPMVALLPPRFKQYIQASSERNIAIVDAPRVISQEILARLQEIDQPIPQVELEAIVCVVSPDSGFRFGVDWGHLVSVNGNNTFNVGMSGLTFKGEASGNGVQDAFSNFAVTSTLVRLLAQEGYLTIRAAPRVTARDGEKAKISIQRETFFSVQPTTSNVFFSQNIQKVDSGISLEIIPRIHGDMVNITIEKAEVSEDLRTSDVRPELTNNPYPIINRRQVSTEVNVRDGNTIVIGGLVQRQTIDRVNKIPGLSRIPIAGNLFKTVEKSEQDAEVAIFISPRIVPADNCSAF